MAFHYDPRVDKRSLMLKQKALCNGERTGRCCAFYWTHVEKVESANSDNLRRGELFRACCFPGTGSTLHVHEMSSEQFATECNQYKPRRLPIFKRPLAWLRVIKDPGKYDPSYEDYNPLTPEEIRQLQAADDDGKVVDQTPIAGDAAQQAAEQNITDMQKQLSAADALAAIDEDDEPGDGIFEKKEDS